MDDRDVGWEREREGQRTPFCQPDDDDDWKTLVYIDVGVCVCVCVCVYVKSCMRVFVCVLFIFHIRALKIDYFKLF